MAARKQKTIDYTNVPETLDEHPFFGLKLDEEQKVFRDAIWNPNIDIVFVDARAGSGKSLVAVATSVLMCQYNLYNGIHYIVAATGMETQGFLPGDLLTRSLPMMSGLWSAIEAIDMFPERVIKGFADMDSQKDGMAFISAETSTFLRGANFTNKVVVLDEAQNFSVSELRKSLTRVASGCKTIVIGHHLQTDIAEQKSGFIKCMEHFRSKNDPRFAFCQLTKCHRGIVAQTADEEW